MCTKLYTATLFKLSTYGGDGLPVLRVYIFMTVCICIWHADLAKCNLICAEREEKNQHFFFIQLN